MKKERHNADRVKEVKAVCRMFVQSTTLDAAFISFNLMLSAAAVFCYKLHSENCTKGLILFFFADGFSFSLKNNWFDYQHFTEHLKKYLKKYLLIQNRVYICIVIVIKQSHKNKRK